MEKIFEIEDKYGQVKDFRVNDVKIWPVYRIILRFLLFRNRGEQTAEKAPASSGITRLLKKVYHRSKHALRILRELPDSHKWLRSYDCIVFSNDLEKREVNNVTIDKLATGLIEQLGEKRTLMVNYPSGNGSKKNRSLKHTVVDGQVIDTMASLLRPAKASISAKDRQLMDQVLHEYQLSEDGLDQIDYFFRKARVIRSLLKKWKPRLVINCCYTYQAEVFAAKNSGIRTVELQHGIISPLHPGYDSALSIDKDFTAEYLLSFGENSTKNLSNNIVNLSNTIPVGNLYLEELFYSPPDPFIQALVSRWEHSVCVPTDFITEKEILGFIIRLAEKNPRIGYLIVPRQDMFEDSLDKISKIENIKVLGGQSFQNVVRHCTIHTATISTCCLEALSLGVPNILINTDGRPKDFYGSLVDEKYTYFVSGVDEYFLSLEKLKGYSKKEIRDSNYKNFSNGYRENLARALKIIQS
jgi:hypothetical protein